MKKIIYLFASSLMVLLLLLSSAPAWAEESPILKIDIQSDKQEYKKDEIAKLTITVENTSDKIAEDVSIANLLPNGLVYAPQQKETTFEHETIQPHSSVEHEVYVKMVDIQVPQTGDESPNMLILALGVLLILGLIAVMRKQLLTAVNHK